MIAIIGGSGAYNFIQTLSDKGWGEYLGAAAIETPFGRANPVHRFRKDSTDYLFLSRHGETGYSTAAPFVNYRANIWALKEAGASRIIAWTGPGAINPELTPGELVVPDDILDMTKSRPSTFYEKKGLGFIRQNPVFCPDIRSAILDHFTRNRLRPNDGGTYVCTEGPRLETPAEIRAFKILGADMVGMTLVPEAFLARELEICYAPICYITNYAEGVRELAYEKGVLFEGTLPEAEKKKVDAALDAIVSHLPDLILSLSAVEKGCPCASAMLRYKKNGIIGDDWRRWIE
ncbi:MAG: MTAP family purine nucleoside phosphorylase [Nitrospirota bacterium]|nr:MTAP family purine nucleoside phosphorylase [Nitrospirota bacterium]